MTGHPRDNRYMRCICNIERIPEIQDVIASVTQVTGDDVVYTGEAAIMDDLDVIDRFTAMDMSYNPDNYYHHCGSLWARRESSLTQFWYHLERLFGPQFSSTIPVIFTRDTITLEDSYY